jgi:hypothetical protein
LAIHQDWNLNGNSIHKNRLTANFYLGSVFIMISILLFIVIIIVCVVWNLILKGELKGKHQQIHTNGLKSSTESYNCRAEARKNLSKKNKQRSFVISIICFLFCFIVVSDSLYDSSPTMTSIDGNHRLKSVAV